MKTLKINATEVITRNPTSPVRHHNVTPVHHTPTRRTTPAHAVHNVPSTHQTIVSTHRAATAISVPEAYHTQNSARKRGGRILL